MNTQRFCAYVGFLFAVASLTAFGYAGFLGDPDDCYPGYEQYSMILLPADCVQGDCADACVKDFTRHNAGGTAYLTVWCECGGVSNGVDDNQFCHATLHYSGPVDDYGWWYDSVDCIKECNIELVCGEVPPPPGGFNTGDKLCDCYF